MTKDNSPWKIRNNISKKVWKIEQKVWNSLKPREKDAKILEYAKENQPFSKANLIKDFDLKSKDSIVYYRLKRLELNHEIKLYKEDRKLELWVLKDYEEKLEKTEEKQSQPVVNDGKLEDDIRKTTIKILHESQYIAYLELPCFYVWIDENAKLHKLSTVFDIYDDDEPVDFDRYERLLKLVAKKIGKDSKNQDFRDEFAKVFSTIVLPIK